MVAHSQYIKLTCLHLAHFPHAMKWQPPDFKYWYSALMWCSFWTWTLLLRYSTNGWRGLYYHNFLFMSLKTGIEPQHCTLTSKTEDLYHKLTVYVTTCEMYYFCGDQPVGTERIVLPLYVCNKLKTWKLANQT